MKIIKPLGAEVTITTTPSSVSDAKLVRLYAAASQKVTIAGTNAGSFTMGVDEVAYLEKVPTDTTLSDGSLLVVAIAYKD